MAGRIVTLALLVADEPIPLIKLRLESRVCGEPQARFGRCGTVMPFPIPIDHKLSVFSGSLTRMKFGARYDNGRTVALGGGGKS
jgi:hypothetical protein